MYDTKKEVKRQFIFSFLLTMSNLLMFSKQTFYLYLKAKNTCAKNALYCKVLIKMQEYN